MGIRLHRNVIQKLLDNTLTDFGSTSFQASRKCEYSSSVFQGYWENGNHPLVLKRSQLDRPQRTTALQLSLIGRAYLQSSAVLTGFEN